jgi:glycosyltransferase involved in cell wall biosynthesis
MVELVTIGITAFNAASTIERAVRSALAQSWRPVEILIVDDGSEDATPEILAELRKEHPEIRLIRHDRNLGIAATRNRILAEARGELLAFFDDDDESLPERVEAQRRRILEYEREFADGAPVICHTARLQLYPGWRPTNGPHHGGTRGTTCACRIARRGKSFVGQKAQGRLWRLRHMFANGATIDLRDRGRL